MAANRIEYQGVTLSDRFLTCHFVVGVGLTIRFAVVKIPIADLHQVGVVPAIDHHVRRMLIDVWSAVDPDEPLPLPPWEA
uniref:Uncharacterized protein n=1 Tax=uncultured prokaryote TaxID=198431 RepID=A0A0H5Q7T2_9ZZZZ|nr:hypothetical protein [uncultured prokaryote]